MNILVTGGAGFIGSNFVRYLRKHHPEDRVIVLDALTYAGNRANLDGLGFKDVAEYGAGFLNDLAWDCGNGLARVNICDPIAVRVVMRLGRFDAVVHLAAESHVDRSIADAAPFIRTNVLGTQVLLDAARRAKVKRFVFASTDEVYGSLTPDDPPATEQHPLAPSSPYAASKAAADLLVLSYVRTYDFPAIVTRCTNNYGPYQFPEKFIPHMILRALAGEPLPLYGDGRNVRDWIHIEDHCTALDAVLRRGRDGEVYNIGAKCERENLYVACMIRDIIHDGLVGCDPNALNDQIQFVADRPGHDRQYALDAGKIRRELGWVPQHTFENGLRETAAWYRENAAWWKPILSGEYRKWVERNYERRPERT